MRPAKGSDCGFVARSNLKGALYTVTAQFKLALFHIF